MKENQMLWCIFQPLCNLQLLRVRNGVLQKSFYLLKNFWWESISENLCSISEISISENSYIAIITTY